jgi:subfamily B ATP-binding cassette protein MsbA
MKDLLRLVKYVRPYMRRVFIAIGSALMVSVCYLALLGLVKPIFDEVLPKVAADSTAASGKLRPFDAARKMIDVGASFSPLLASWSKSLSSGSKPTAVLIAALIVVLFLLKGIFTYLTAYMTRWTGLQAVRDLRADLYGRVQRQSLAFFSEHSTGHLLSRIMGDVGRLQRLVSGDLAEVFRLTALVLGQSVYLFYLNWRLAGFCLVILPLLVFPVARMGRRLKDVSRGGMQKMGDASLVMKEGITGTRVVQAFGMEQFEVDRFVRALDRVQRAEKRAARIVSVMGPVMELIGAVGAAVLFTYAAHRIAAGKLSAGDFVTFVAALFMIYTGIRNLVKINNDLQQSLAAAQRVFEIMDQPSLIVERPEAIPLPAFQSRIEFQAVSFAYGKAPVIRGIDLTVRRGQVVALVGSSGAGKSTLVNLLPRFYDVTEGAILFDGRDIRDVTLASLRQSIGLVTQEVLLFNDTVRNNIAYGRVDVPMERVEAAARAAHAQAFIESLPQGYDTELGESGHRLSHGQRQRLSIARAILKDAPILILDEATSSLDSESEAEVQAALENLMQGRTVFVIAHRLSTVRRADVILVMDSGRIVERGAHADLLAEEGVYARLHRLQFRDPPAGHAPALL